MPVKEFKLPDVGEGVAEGELVTWLVKPGDRVEEDQPVAEVETDKALVEVPSRYDGVVEELFVEEGEMVPVGDVIISFRVDGDGAEPTADDTGSDEVDDTDGAGDDADGLDAESEAEPETSSGRTFAPPSVRRLARELGVDIAAVEGSGPGGRISDGDVRAHAESSGSAGSGPSGEDDSSGPKPVDIGSGDRKSAVSKRGGSADDDTRGDDARSTGVDPAGRETTLATPATRKVARELGVDIDDVPTDATREGDPFVDEAAVRAYAEAGTAAVPATTDSEPAPEPEPTPASAGGSSGGSGFADASTDREPETVPYRGVRRTIGKQMERSKFTAPHVTHHDTAEVDALVEAREQLKPKAEARDVKLTYMPFVMKAIVAGLKEHPYLNSELREDDEEIVLKKEYNLGIAVATDAGLMVPVVKGVDEKGIFELAEEVNDLATRARERKIKPAEMKGGTFTITNFGAIGGEYATPIINYPETAILGLGAIEERPVVRDRSAVDDGFLDDEEGTTVVPVPTLPLSLSIDHRVVDGAIAAEFANTVMEHLENPLLLLNH
ncbi:pyruvate dehydrogenase E2 component (dihydrolipoamide acetyltransferase) [Halorubrum alkaliphilum]|uniref:Pyruvate dehydrogenase E2 component (Dihydrolipoamide acetyltransferase) n=1 Tax=Halorubrum alkaliphilum TaxID=261290 RepID=A0A8T4GHB7_9EURY|nr:2-oxo acid dehydrogenase subunit E2 [Halorubrum alkaliphilum]MBP1923878.1 pyruvate dehydrogenase E2 component (dihydrolipoamide acetyltransferase) [Halorubrum alkaliphilum]